MKKCLLFFSMILLLFTVCTPTTQSKSKKCPYSKHSKKDIEKWAWHYKEKDSGQLSQKPYYINATTHGYKLYYVCKHCDKASNIRIGKNSKAEKDCIFKHTAARTYIEKKNGSSYTVQKCYCSAKRTKKTGKKYKYGKWKQ